MNAFARVSGFGMLGSISGATKKIILSFINRHRGEHADDLPVSEQDRQEPTLITSLEKKLSHKGVHQNLVDGEIRQAPTLHTDVYVQKSLF